MNRSWKKFTVIVSVMLAVIICCTAWNVALDKITGSIEPETNVSENNYSDTGNQVNAGTNNQGTAQNGTTVTNVNGQTVTQQNGTVANNNSGASNNSGGSNNSAQPQASAVLGYDKNQLVAYYNACLKSSYSQARMTDRKTEQVTIGVDSVTINGGEKNDMITSIANSIASSNQKQVDETKSFSGGRASDGTAASTYVLPANLSASGVKSASVSRNGNGYKVVITLVAETCGHNTKPPHNASCAWPLDINEVAGALNGFAEVTQAQFKYPGTTLTANIDAAGRVNFVRVDMPLTVTDGTGVVTKNIPGFKGMTITASAHGKWVCTHTMSF